MFELENAILVSNTYMGFSGNLDLSKMRIFPRGNTGTITINGRRFTLFWPNISGWTFQKS
ncbi:MAG TPA: hypothetical protein DER10_11680 [Elusimicrobia bacterium]|nr:MAG: hypothetical protein A2X33_05810 [Elusimicrobia bacterium GWA2_51_34]HCE99144.1 hypothetical protein [Elusimicrobiota bacterium]